MTGANDALGARPRALDPFLFRPLGDDRLARLAAAGDGRAFAAIFRRYASDLHRYCQAILGNPEDAADALQNTMVSTLRALPGEQRAIALKPWLFRVAHNEAISLLRQRRPEVELEADQVLAPGAGAEFAIAERLRRLVGDLRQLPERQRGALVMRELSGMSFAEIGAALGCSAAAARQVVYEARTGLHGMAEGRDLDCGLVRQAISECDGRIMRGRRLRAHLRDCDACSGFRAAIRERREDLGLLAPALALPAAAMLKGLGAASGAAGTGAGIGIGGSAAFKSATAILAAATIAGGVAASEGLLDLPAPGARDGAPDQASPGRVPIGAGGGDRPQTPSSNAGAGAATERGSADAARSQRSSQRSAPATSAGDPTERANGSGPGPGRSTSEIPGSTSGQVQTPPGQVEAPPVDGGTPPGQVKTPPGQVKTPPGQVTTPPGQAANESVPPGQAATPPGQAQTPPGQAQTPPGQTHVPPGQIKPK